MINVVCSILVVVGGFQTKADVEGSIIKEGDFKYIVDFREGLKKEYPKVQDINDYAKKLVDKSDCVKE